MKNAWFEEIKKDIPARLEDYEGTTHYVCDMGFMLTEGENANGSWYCSRKEAQNAVYDYFNTVISHSWTWERLTDDEKERFKTCIDFSRITGTKQQRIKVLNMVYSAFLHGVGYKPIGWREPDPEAPQF